MRYRKLTADGDYRFGQAGSFHVNTPAAVAQAVHTRLLLWTGEWFLDTQEGTPYMERILGVGTQGIRDSVIRSRILGTEGVEEITEYASSEINRTLQVACTVKTIYGVSTAQTTTVLR